MHWLTKNYSPYLKKIYPVGGTLIHIDKHGWMDRWVDKLADMTQLFAAL